VWVCVGMLGQRVSCALSLPIDFVFTEALYDGSWWQSFPLPCLLQDHKVRVFSKVRDPAVIASIRSAFRTWTDHFNRSQQFSSRIELYTPHKYKSSAHAARPSNAAAAAAAAAAASGAPKPPAAANGLAQWQGSSGAGPLTQEGTQEGSVGLLGSQGAPGRSCSSNGAGATTCSGADSTGSKKRQRSLLLSYPPPIAE
jgi:hypothetical protein